MRPLSPSVRLCFLSPYPNRRNGIAVAHGAAFASGKLTRRSWVTLRYSVALLLTNPTPIANQKHQPFGLANICWLWGLSCTTFVIYAPAFAVDFTYIPPVFIVINILTIKKAVLYYKQKARENFISFRLLICKEFYDIICLKAYKK